MDRENDLINLIEFFKVLWSGKIVIIITTAIFAISGVFYSLSLPNLYKSTAVLITVENNDTSTGPALLSQYNSLASFAGITLPSSSANKADYAMELIKSRFLLKRLIEKYKEKKIKAKLFAVEGYDNVNKKIIYNKNLYDEKNNVWINSMSELDDNSPTYLQIYRSSFKNLQVSKDKISGFITISYVHKSPEFAAEFIDMVVNELNLITKEIDFNESSLSLDYLKKELSESTQVEIKNSINSLITSQLNTLMLSSVKNDYLLKYLDQPYVPEIKYSPKRALICITWTFIGFFISLIYILSSRYIFLNNSK